MTNDSLFVDAVVRRRVRAFMANPIHQVDASDAATFRTLLAYAMRAANAKRTARRRYRLHLHKKSVLEPPPPATSPYRKCPATTNTTPTACDFLGCALPADPVACLLRSDVQRCALHARCCVFEGCALPAEFRIRSMRNRCAIHGGSPTCAFPHKDSPACPRIARELSGFCAHHEPLVTKHACSFPQCTANQWTDLPSTRVCGGLFQRCARHGGEWFCREPRCIDRPVKASGAAMLCERHFAPQRAALALHSVCRQCVHPINARGSKREGLCASHFRTQACVECNEPNACAPPPAVQTCNKCTQSANRARKREALQLRLAQHQAEKPLDVDACPLCAEPKLGWWRSCLQCVGRDQCVGCYGPKTKSAQYCRACRREYSALVFKQEESRFAHKLKQLTEKNPFYLHARYSARDMQLTCARGSNCRRRPDFLYVLPHHALVVELDEGYHAGYSLQSEVRRLDELACALHTHHKLALCVVRVNARAYDMPTVMGVIERMCTMTTLSRDSVLVECIGYPPTRFARLQKRACDLYAAGVSRVIFRNNFRTLSAAPFCTKNVPHNKNHNGLSANHKNSPGPFKE